MRPLTSWRTQAGSFRLPRVFAAMVLPIDVFFLPVTTEPKKPPIFVAFLPVRVELTMLPIFAFFLAETVDFFRGLGVVAFILGRIVQSTA